MGDDLLDTCKLYITEISSRENCKISQKKGGRDLLRSPLNQPCIIYIETLSFSIFYVLLKIQFGNSQEKFDNMTCPTNPTWKGNLFLFVYHFPVITTKWIIPCATLKIFLLLNDRKQVFGWLSLNPEMICMQI